MIKEEKIIKVMDAFFAAIKPKEDYKIESTNLTYYQTLDLIKESASASIKDNPEKFEIIVSWFIVASMYLLEDIEELDDIDLQLRNAI